MNCKYYYGTKVFNSELELDDFLLDRGPELMDKYEDFVGQEAAELRQLKWAEVMDDFAENSFNERKNGTTRYDTYAQSQDIEYQGTIAVTRFLSGLEVGGHLLFPKFEEEIYFQNRIKSWKSNKEKRFTPRELEDFAEEPEFKDNKVPTVMSQELIDRLITIEKQKWDNEALVGSAIHNLCEIFFSKISYSRKNQTYRIWGDETDQKIMERFNKKASRETKDILSIQQMTDVIAYCRRLRREIETNYGGTKGGRFLYYPELSVKAPAENPKENKHVQLSGTIDLLVVPPEGDPFIIDYKVSPNDYSKEAERDLLPEDVEPDAYNRAKKLGFSYQLATYGRMLAHQNPVFRNIKVLVAPIQLMEYKRKNGVWSYKNIREDGKILDDLFKEQSHEINVQDNLDSIFADVSIAQIDQTDILKKIKETMLKWFTQYRSKEFGWTIQEIEELINDKNHSYKENKEAEDIEKRFSYQFQEGKTVYGKTKLELIKNIQEMTKSYERRVGSTTKRFKDAVANQSEPSATFSSRIEHSDGRTNWYTKVVRKYVKDGQYRVLGLSNTEQENGAIPKTLENMGIVLLKNLLTDHIEVLAFTHEKVDSIIDKKNVNKLITQALGIADVVDKSGKNFLLEATNGNAKIIETLLALHFVAPEVFKGTKIHSIKVINPFLNSGITASNKQILYAYETLNKHRALDKNFGKNRIFYNNHPGDIKFCTALEQAIDSLRSGYRLRMLGGSKKSRSEAEEIRNKCLDPLARLFFEKKDEVIDVVGNSQSSSPKNNIEAIQTAIMDMEEIIPGLREQTLDRRDFDVTDEEIQVQYQSLLMALAEESGYDFQQQIKAYDNYKDSWNILMGHSGLRTDNPGTTASSNLNKITEFIDNCYKRVTDALQRPHAKTQELIRKMKKNRNITYLGDSTFQNSIKIYDRLTNAKDRNPDDDWLFVNPFSPNSNLDATESEFLKYILTNINYNRFHKRNETMEDFKQRQLENINAGKEAWLRVPLSYKGTQGKLETQGLLSAAKDYFRSWLPSEAKARIRKEMEHLLTPEGIEAKNDLYSLRTRFDMGEREDKRAEMLKDINSYDHDLQSVFLHHMFAYKMKEESMKACMLIKAAHADIINQEFTQNRLREAETRYLVDNVKIMLGKNIMDQEDLQIYYFAKKIMRLASIGALGFNPKQIYQLLEGIYKDIGIVWRNEDGRFGFTLKEMITSFIDVYKEMGKFGFQPTKLERLNQLYRINDMDINVYAEHLQNSHNIFRNTSNFIFRFASRPDFYNRMTIFESYMRHDGTFDAYKLNKEGELIYDFASDPRFNLLAEGKVKDLKYREQEALYRAMAKQFEIEGAIYADGTEFKLRPAKNGVYEPLPQAYTNKQARSFKSMADKMYGYYSHEKRALMQASLMGSLIWQMNTYWSGKKNQWFAISSVKDRGHFTHYSELVLDEEGKPVIKDGQEQRIYYYIQVNEDGSIAFDEPPVPYDQLRNKNIIIPFIQWEGAFSEGIVVTLTSMLWDVLAMNIADNQNFIRPRGSTYEQLLNPDGSYSKNLLDQIQAVHNQYWNNTNENLRTAYRQNLRQFAYDMGILLFIGGIVGSQVHEFANDYMNEHKDDHTVQQGLANASLALAEAIFDTSTLDFNPIESVAGRGVNWTPFAITTMTRMFHTWSRVVSGDDSVFDGFLKTFSASRTTLKPLVKQLTDPEVKREQQQEEQAENPDQEKIQEAVQLVNLSYQNVTQRQRQRQ